MGNELMAYMERLELMAFFLAYPLIYALVHVLAEKTGKNITGFFSVLKKLLPYAYAFSGALFLGYILKNMYPDYSIKNIAAQFENPWLKAWGLLTILFFVPALAKKSVLSLLHSLVFFFLLIKDLLVYNPALASNEMVKNDMKVYTDSIIVNIISLAAVTAVYYLLKVVRNKKK